MTIDDLQRLKGQIATKTAEKARAEGALENLLSTLEKEFGTTTTEGAEAMIEGMEQEIGEMQTTLDRGLAELREVIK